MEEDALLRHLLAERALANSEESRIDRYIELVNNLRSRVDKAWLAIKSTFDREIILIFELVIEEKLDPCEIDLTKFASLYLKKIKKDREIELITAGYLILLAWNILRKQSDNLLESATPKTGEELFPWDVIPEWAGNENYTSAILSGAIALEEKIYRKGARRVTLLDLVTAFEEAKKYVETRKLRMQAREEYAQKAFKDALITLDEKLVKEELEGDASKLWHKICKLATFEPIALSTICNGSKEEYITGIISTLYLANQRKLRVWQNRFPYGEIYVKRLM